MPPITGRYAGAFTRLLSFLLDWAIIVVVYGLIVASTTFILDIVFGLNVEIREGHIAWIIGLIIWAIGYLWFGLATAGRTVGMVVVGLRCVARDGSPLGAGAAFVRVLAFPLSFAIFGLGFLGILFGRERRALHDVIARCAVVYDWGDRPAALPSPLTRWLEKRGAFRQDAEEAQPLERTATTVDA